MRQLPGRQHVKHRVVSQTTGLISRLLLLCGIIALAPSLKAQSISLASWGDNASGQTNIPPEATNLVAVAAGYSFNLAARADGSVLAWGDNSLGQTNVPPAATNVVA